MLFDIKDIITGYSYPFNPWTLRCGTCDDTDQKIKYPQQILTKSPEVIKILLGDACNFRCAYCRQSTHNKKEKINYETLNTFVHLLLNNLDLSNLRKVEFWGGEPLLYWDEIQFLKNKFLNINKDCVLHLTTNGSLITKDICKELISGPNYMIKLSHDGPGQFLRTKDPIKLHREEIFKLKEELLPRDLFWINTVLTRECTSPGAIVNYFKELFDDPYIKIMKIEPVIPYNDFAKKYTLKSDQLNIFEDQFLNDLKTYRLEHNVFEYSELLRFFLISQVKDVEYNFAEMKCIETQKKTLTVDYFGNIVPCQVYNKNDNLLGHIINIDSINMNIDNSDRINRCKECPVVSLCRGVCPFIKDKETIEMNCRVRYHTYSALLKYFLYIVYSIDAAKIVKRSVC